MVMLESLFWLFASSQRSWKDSMSTQLNAFQSWIPSDAIMIEEPSALNILKDVCRKRIMTCTPFGSIVEVDTSYVLLPSKRSRNVSLNDCDSSRASRFAFLSPFIPSLFRDLSPPQYIQALPIVLVHGFDSSCLEYRRLAPLLNEDRDVYAMDVLGWGFNDHREIKDFSPDAKIAHLRDFIKSVVGGPCILVGASLGGAIGIILAAEYPELVDKLVLIDAQGFIDGNGRSNMPDFMARLGVRLLKSEPLRNYANFIAYTDKSIGTPDAMRCGRLHCFMDSWEDASVDFVLSGGFKPSSRVSRVQQPTLVLWGANDNILDPSTAEKFRETLPKPTVVVVNDCGHIPHLEKPELVASEVLRFIENR